MRLTLCTLTFLGAWQCFAELSTVTINLINKSTNTFKFEGAVVQHQGTSLRIDRKEVPPNTTAVVTGTIDGNSDLVGTMYFSGNALFWVIDYRQFHSGLPTFDFQSSTAASKLPLLTLNPTLGPRLLNYSAADVVIQDR